MEEKSDNISVLIFDYLNGTIPDDLRQVVEDWKAENKEEFEGYRKVCVNV